MAFRFVLFAAVVAVAQAGGPASYDIATASADYSSIGYTQESTDKGYGNQNVVTYFSKAVDSPYSSVRVSNNRVSTDAYITQSLTPAYSYAAHVPVVTKAAYALPALQYAHAASIIAKSYSSAPAVSYSSISTPIVAKAAYTEPTYSYAAAPPIIARADSSLPSHRYAAAAPVVTKAAHAAPSYSYAATAPVFHTSFDGSGIHYVY